MCPTSALSLSALLHTTSPFIFHISRVPAHARAILLSIGYIHLAFQRLPREQKEALRMIGIEERSYEEAAGATGCAVGTLVTALSILTAVMVVKKPSG